METHTSVTLAPGDSSLIQGVVFLVILEGVDRQVGNGARPRERTNDQSELRATKPQVIVDEDVASDDGKLDSRLVLFVRETFHKGDEGLVRSSIVGVHVCLLPE